MFTLWPGQAFVLLFVAAFCRAKDEANLFALDAGINRKIEEGKAQIQEFEGLEAKDYPCWREAKSQLLGSNSCQKMTYERRARVAVALTNCHLLKSGLEAYPCPVAVNILTCTKRIGQSPLAYQTYNNFFTHVDNICSFVHKEAFQRTTQKLINQVYTATRETGDTLQNFAKDAKNLNAQILGDIKDKHDQLSDGMDALTAQQSRSFADMQMTTEKLSENQDSILRALMFKSEEITTALSKTLQTQKDVQNVQDQMRRSVQETADQMQELQKQQNDGFEQSLETLGVIRTEQGAVRSQLQDASSDLAELKREQLSAFAAAEYSLKSIQSKQTSILADMSSTQGELSKLSDEQRKRFAAATSHLASVEQQAVRLAAQTQSQLRKLGTEQADSFAKAHQSLETIHQGHESIVQGQANIASSVSETQEKIEELQQKTASFSKETLENLAEISKESKLLQTVLGDISGNLRRLAGFDHTLLGEVFFVSSPLFYSLFCLLLYYAMKAERVWTVRWKLWCALVVTCWAEYCVCHFQLLSVDAEKACIVIMRRLLAAFAVGAVVLQKDVLAWFSCPQRQELQPPSQPNQPNQADQAGELSEFGKFLAAVQEDQAAGPIIPRHEGARVQLNALGLSESSSEDEQEAEEPGQALPEERPREIAESEEDLQKLTLLQLRAKCKTAGVKVRGGKGELVARLFNRQ